MPRWVSALCLIGLLLFICGCDFVDDDDEALLHRAKSSDYELVKKEEINELRKQADLGKSIGRYQIYRNGFRTWRLDTSTGSTCILLTSEDDWKKPETASSGCDQ